MLQQHHHHSLVLFLFLLLPLLLLCRSSASLSSGDGSGGDPSAAERALHEALRAHGLPIGLLPRGVVEFRWVDGGGGTVGRRFEVSLERACNARFENEVHYEMRVTGAISYGQIGGLSGVSAQELFLWFPVRGIRVDVPSSGLIYFDVGVIYKQFSLSLFETPPICTAAAVQSTPRKLCHELDREDAQRRGILYSIFKSMIPDSFMFCDPWVALSL